MTLFSMAGRIDGNFKAASRMRAALALTGFGLLTLAPIQAHADMFKCKDANGKFSYQQVPCEKNAGQQHLRQGPRRLILLGNNNQKPKPRPEQ